jgi:lipoprotein-anchoring transpeptidase ErfK/SrfK
VLAEPRRRADYIGKVTRGTRVAWKRVTPGSDVPEGDVRTTRRTWGTRKPCEFWVNVEPAGYLCSDQLKPSPLPPEGRQQPVLRAGSLLPFAYYAVLNDATPAYASVDDIRAGTVKKPLSKKYMVVGGGVTDVDGVPYMKTDHGFVEQAALGRYGASAFSGLDLRAQPPASWPFAWLVGARGAKVKVLAEPNEDAEVVRRAARREIVPVLEEQGEFVRVATGEWIERAQVRIARLTEPPPGATGGGQWIDVDLDEQVLVAYEGRAPVFATLVSTGRNKHATPPATYQVRAKAATTPMMGGDKDSPHRYEISEVPWAVRFRDGLFIHTAYWHDSFGNVVSHGCVNLSPRDAAFVFDWIEPKLPEGWSEVEVPLGRGAFVRIRDREQPTPAAHDYSREEPVAAAQP